MKCQPFLSTRTDVKLAITGIHFTANCGVAKVIGNTTFKILIQYLIICCNSCCNVRANRYSILYRKHFPAGRTLLIIDSHMSVCLCHVQESFDLDPADSELSSAERKSPSSDSVSSLSSGGDKQEHAPASSTAAADDKKQTDRKPAKKDYEHSKAKKAKSEVGSRFSRIFMKVVGQHQFAISNYFFTAA